MCGPSRGAMHSSKYDLSGVGPASRIGSPASRAASIARCGAFSRTRRPDPTTGPPPGPYDQAAVSTPLRIGVLATTCDHACAVDLLTAVNDEPAAEIAIADSS